MYDEEMDRLELTARVERIGIAIPEGYEVCSVAKSMDNRSKSAILVYVNLVPKKKENPSGEAEQRTASDNPVCKLRTRLGCLRG